MINFIEWVTNTSGCGGLIAMSVFTIAIIIYTLSLRWVQRAQHEPREEEPQ